jgi:hypothetical protein
MAVRTKSPSAQSMKKKARELLAFVEDHAPKYKDPAELFIVVFGPHGKATMMFPTKNDWAALARTPEIKKIYRILEAVPVNSRR